MANERVTHFLPPGEKTSIIIEGKEYTPVVPAGFQHVFVGVETVELDPDTGQPRKEIIVDPETGLNQARTAVEAHEVYNFKKQKRSNWFILDLETGSHGWYPGCKIVGSVLEIADIKEAPSEDSATLETIINAKVEVLDIEAIDQEPSTPG